MKAPKVLAGQPLHWLLLTALLAATGVTWNAIGRPHAVAFWTTISTAIFHQLFVWLCWRLELANHSVSRTIGYPLYLAIFFGLLISRVISISWLACVDQNSMPTPAILRNTLVIVLGIPWVYTVWSVHRYFGFHRAAGADHFYTRYRKMPLVKNGAFGWTSNAMYAFGFFALWIIAIALESSTALMAAAFHHSYIWVHYYTTELADLKFLYRSTD